MATYTSNFLIGEEDTNVFDTSLLSALLRSAPNGAELQGGTQMSYIFGPVDSFSFTASGGFTAPWTGTITGIVSVAEENTVSTASGFSASGTAVRDAIAAGDTAALNALFWSGNDRITGSASDDTLRGFDGRDALTGGGGSDTLMGDGGNDRLSGGGDNDNLFGGAGNDRLFGGAGSDVIVGGAGRDLIGGGAGSDTMSGGAGADTFEFRSLGQLKGDDIDRITDFSHSEGDKIDVHFIDADKGTPGDQAYTYVDNTLGTIDFPPAAGSLVVGTGSFPNTYSVSLYFDGAGHALTFIVTSLEGPPTAADFIL